MSAIKFDCAKSQEMTQERADALWDIACTAAALAADPPHKDVDKILVCLRKTLEKQGLKFKGRAIPEAGFSWR